MMRHLLALFATLFALPAAAHGVHANVIDGHDHGALVVALLAVPLIAVIGVAAYRHLRR